MGTPGIITLRHAYCTEYIALAIPPPPISVSAMCMVPALFNLPLLHAWRKQNFSFVHAYTRDRANNGMVCDTTRGLTSPVTRVDQLPPSHAQSLISNDRDRALYMQICHRHFGRRFVNTVWRYIEKRVVEMEVTSPLCSRGGFAWHRACIYIFD